MVRTYPINQPATPPPSASAVAANKKASVNINTPNPGGNQKLGDALYQKYLNHVKNFQASESGKKLMDLYDSAKPFLHSFKRAVRLLGSVSDVATSKFDRVKKKRMLAGISGVNPGASLWREQLREHRKAYGIEPNIGKQAIDFLNEAPIDNLPTQLPDTYDINNYNPGNQNNQNNQTNQAAFPHGHRGQPRRPFKKNNRRP